MSWLKKLFTGGVGEAVEKIGGMVERVSAGHLGKKELKLEVEKMLHERDMTTMAQVTAEIGAKEKVMVAELQQGDSYTKRARPSIVYAGLLAAFIDAIGYIEFTMPTDFWYVWGGVCGIYAIGRSAEKRGNGNKLTRAITGSRILGDAP